MPHGSQAPDRVEAVAVRTVGQGEIEAGTIDDSSSPGILSVDSR
jgi:hypothetical protein